MANSEKHKLQQISLKSYEIVGNVAKTIVS